MNQDVIISCAVTGAGDTVGKHPAIPVTPRQIADAAIEAAEAGAAIAHLHVRDPPTGKAGRELEHYREAVELIRSLGRRRRHQPHRRHGRRLLLRSGQPGDGGRGTDMANAAERVAHVEALRPEICTLDCGSLNFGDGAFMATADLLRDMAARIKAAGVKPEIECFELGHIWLAKDLIKRGLIDAPPLFQLCLGIPWGAEATTEAMLAMRNHLPPGANWAGFAIGRSQMAFVAQSMLLGGNVRVGLEDNIWLDRGVHASNGSLDAARPRDRRAARRPRLVAGEARQKLGLTKQR